VLSNLVCSLRQRHSRLHVWPILHVRTAASRVRVPDVCASLEDPGTEIFETPPQMCIEILSTDDSMSDLLEKLEEYAAMGVPHIWVVDPRRRKAFTYHDRRLEEVLSGRIETAPGEISLPLEEVFLNL